MEAEETEVANQVVPKPYSLHHTFRVQLQFLLDIFIFFVNIYSIVGKALLGCLGYHGGMPLRVSRFFGLPMKGNYYE
jgi:hypothetical protein